jgi:phosphonate degradation associated HDIG domain protein
VSDVTVEAIFELFERFGEQRYDEDLSQRLHAEQTAALAAADGASESLVAAALLHDVGHLLELAESGAEGRDRATDRHHEGRGSAWLASAFGPDVTAPIALHVRAKRYLCAVDPTYHARLSPGSQASLARQGGPLSAEAAAAFEGTAGATEAGQLRRWDDQAKDPGLVVAPLVAYRPLLDALTRP